MKKLKDDKSGKGRSVGKRLLLIVPGVVALVLTLGFLFRGWVRVTVVPKTVTAMYGGSIQHAVDDELNKLQNPLEALGYKNIEKKPVRCVLGYTKGFTTEINCGVEFSAYYEVSQNEADKANLSKNAEKLQALLQQNGWDGEYGDMGDYTSLKKLVSNINNGIDYTPDASYQKDIGSVHCLFDSNTAFSSPKPAAISSHIFCSRTFDMFGKPYLPN